MRILTRSITWIFIVLAISYSLFIATGYSFLGLVTDAQVVMPPAKAGEYLSENEYFNPLDTIVKGQPEVQQFVFAYLGDISLTCASGNVLVALDALSQKSEQASFYAILPDDYTENDLNNLSTNYPFNVRFTTVSPSFQAYLEKNISPEDPFPLTGLILVTDGSGRISYIDRIFRETNVKEKVGGLLARNL